MVTDLNLNSQPFLNTMPLYVIMSKNPPAAAMQSFRLYDLLNYPYVSYSDSSSLQYLQLWGLDRHPSLLIVSDRAGFYDAIRSGTYLSLLSFLGHPQSEEFVYVPVDETQFFINCRLITRHDYQLTQRDRAFLSFLSTIE